MATKSKRFKPFFSFLCFFLGVSGLLLSVGPGLRLAKNAGRAYGLQDLACSDYQQSRAFRQQLCQRLGLLLTMGAGGPVNGRSDGYGYFDYDCGWGGSWLWEEEYWEDEYWLWEEALHMQEEAAAGGVPLVVTPQGGDGGSEKEGRELQAAREKELQRRADACNEYLAPDLNLLYSVFRDGKLVYTNAAGKGLDGAAGKLPAGYNFLLYFDGEKASATKDGQPLDLYGDGYYEPGDWYLPGYKNFPAGQQAAGVQVALACAEEPILYLSGRYGDAGGAAEHSAFYWIERNLYDARRQLALSGAGLLASLLLLAAGLALGQGRKKAVAAITRLTGRIPLEAKVAATLIVLFLLFWPTALRLGEGGLWQELSFALTCEDDGAYAATLLSEGSWALFRSTGWLCGLFWLCWLWAHDLRANPKCWRVSFFSTAGLRLPLQKRLVRRGWAMAAAALVVAGCSGWLLVLGFAGVSQQAFLLFAALDGCLFLIFLFALLLFLHCQRQLARDTGALVEQVASVRAGNLSLPLDLPADSDLAAAARDLAQIQQGMGTALEERLKSEQMKVELIANVSHDIKTPLTSIIGYIELLRREQGLPGHVQEYVAILDQKSQRLKTLVQDVVEISKAAAGQLPVHPKPLDLGKLLQQTVADMDGAIAAAPVTLRASLPEQPVFIRADGQRLYRVFQNLIQNALQYSLPGSRVYLTLTAGPGQACACVKNTSATELPAGVDFTQRFVRGDASRTDGGNGLGLSIARSFTEACGGRFSVETDADLFCARVIFAPCPAPDPAQGEGGPDAAEEGPVQGGEEC